MGHQFRGGGQWPHVMHCASLQHGVILQQLDTFQALGHPAVGELNLERLGQSSVDAVCAAIAARRTPADLWGE
ncbi:hypothetical protein B1987_04890 [Mycobacterium kansasii]|nr:hypothetical protein B1987_04890 [Mycobacterium kansasii]